MSPTSFQTALPRDNIEWAEVDSNHRRRCQQIYSLSPLATRESAHDLNNYEIVKIRGAYRARTYDPLLVRQMLSQLSYAPIALRYSVSTTILII